VRLSIRDAVEDDALTLAALRNGVADDLTKLHHVSPTIEKKLNDLGIFHYWQIAGLGPEAAHKIAEEVGLPGRVEGWIAQSKELTAE